MRTISYVAIVLALGACSGAPVETGGETGEPHLNLAPERPIFTRNPSGWVAVEMVLSHRGGRAIELTGCPDPVASELERQAGGAWHQADRFQLLCLGIYSPTTLTLRVGEAFRFSVPVREPGHYRVLAHIGPTWGAPEFKVPSAAFTVE